MAIYFKPVVDNNWFQLGNWFTNIAGTIPAAYVPWAENNAYKSENLAFATGVTVSPTIGNLDLGNGFSITGTCNMTLTLGYSDQGEYFPASIYSGTYSAAITAGSDTIFGGTFNSTVTGAVIQGGTFNGTVSAVGVITGGTFNGATASTGGASGGTFNSGFTQTSGNVTGGTFNGSYTRVTGNVTGGTFNNGTINQFYRNGFPPPIAFGGYNPNAFDVLGTGL